MHGAIRPDLHNICSQSVAMNELDNRQYWKMNNRKLFFFIEIVIVVWFIILLPIKSFTAIQKKHQSSIALQETYYGIDLSRKIWERIPKMHSTLIKLIVRSANRRSMIILFSIDYSSECPEEFSLNITRVQYYHAKCFATKPELDKLSSISAQIKASYGKSAFMCMCDRIELRLPTSNH